MAEFDLLPKITPYLDKHLLFPLLEHVQKLQIYPEDEVVKAQLSMLSRAKLVDFEIEKHKLLHKSDEVPPAMKEKRQQVLLQLKELKADCKQLLTVLEDPALAKIPLKAPSPQEREKSGSNVHYRDMLVSLVEKHSIKPEHIEALYRYAKLHFECGNYGQVDEGGQIGAAEMLPVYRMLTSEPNSDTAIAALWGKLAAAILLEKWDDAVEDLYKLREIIDTKQFSSHLVQLQQRTWLIHWSLFVYFKPQVATHPNFRGDVIDLFFSPAYLNTIQTNCPHILRYLTTAVITNPRRRNVPNDNDRRINVLNDLVRIIQQERPAYSDPITEFVECLLVNFDFDSAQEKLRQCEVLLSTDYFLQALKEEFIQNARLFIFETYCRIHQCIDIKMLAEKLNMGQEEAELWIVNLIRNARLDAKIDSEKHHVIMGSTKPSAYQQVKAKGKSLCFRSYVLGGNFQKQATGFGMEMGPGGGDRRDGDRRDDRGGGGGGNY